MSTDVVIYAIATVGLLVGTGIVARAEFQKRFSKTLYGLRPRDLRDSAFKSVLDGTLHYESVRTARHWYTFWSVLIAGTAAGLVACTAPVGWLVEQTFPPALFKFLEIGAQNSRFESVFWCGLFFAVAFHALPLVSVFLLSDSTTREQSVRKKGNPIAEFMYRLFAFQEYILERTLDKPLQCVTSSGGESDEVEASVVGRNVETVRQGIGKAMVEETDPELLKKLYRQILPVFKPPLGWGVSQIQQMQPSTVGGAALPKNSHQMIFALIDRHGVHVVRSELSWRTRRKTDREDVHQKITVDVDGERTDVWIENVGRPRRERHWNSFLMNDKLLGAKLRDGTPEIRVVHIGRQNFSKNPIDAAVCAKREKGAHLAIKVVDPGRRRFHRAIESARR